MKTKRKLYKVYGVVSADNVNYKVRRDNSVVEYEDTEFTNGVLSVQIQSYGDDTSLAYVEILCANEESGALVFETLAKTWPVDVSRGIWGL